MNRHNIVSRLDTQGRVSLTRARVTIRSHVRYQLSKRLVPHRCLSSSPDEHTIELLSELPPSPRTLFLPLCFSFLSLSDSTHFAGGIKCDVGIYVDENHIVYTNPCGRSRSREYTCAPSVRCAWASGTYCCPSNPVSPSTTTHAITHAYHGQTVRPPLACRGTFLRFARSLARFVSLARAVAVYTSGTNVGRRYTALAGAAASWIRVPCRSPPSPPAPVCYTDNIFRKHVG